MKGKVITKKQKKPKDAKKDSSCKALMNNKKMTLRSYTAEAITEKIIEGISRNENYFDNDGNVKPLGVGYYVDFLQEKTFYHTLNAFLPRIKASLEIYLEQNNLDNLILPIKRKHQDNVFYKAFYNDGRLVVAVSVWFLKFEDAVDFAKQNKSVFIDDVMNKENLVVTEILEEIKKGNEKLVEQSSKFFVKGE